MKLIESKTYFNLAKAYAGECQARVRYEFIEFGARQQGYKCLAEQVDKVVFNEFNHARMFYTKLQDAEVKEIKNIDICAGYPFKEKWDLKTNLKLAADDEEAEIKLYPEFADIAEKEGFTEIATLFRNIAKIEQSHYELFTCLYNQFSKGTLYKKDKQVLWKCSHCGYEVIGNEAPKICPVCGEKQGSFEIVCDK